LIEHVALSRGVILLNLEIPLKSYLGLSSSADFTIPEPLSS
jgi:hypothetical protein